MRKKTLSNYLFRYNVHKYVTIIVMQLCKIIKTLFSRNNVMGYIFLVNLCSFGEVKTCLMVTA